MLSIITDPEIIKKLNDQKVNYNDPNSIAMNLGSPGNAPGFDTNKSGSFEDNYNQVLNTLSPAQLIQRYSNPNLHPAMLNSSLDQANYAAHKSFTSMFGRAPTESEFSQVQAAFQGPNGGINGRAYLANLHQQYQSDPSNPMSPFNPQNPNNTLSKQNDQVNKIYQNTLGRDANPQELSAMSGALGSNQMNPFQAQQMLQQMPEYTNKIDTQFRQGLSGQLNDINQQFFGRAKDQVLGQLAQNGTQNSTAMDSAITDLMGRMATQNQGFMANLSSQQYGGNKNLAAGDYSNQLNQMQMGSGFNRQNQQGYGQQLLGQGFAGADYLTQRNDYQNGISNNRPNPTQGNFWNYANMGMNAVADYYTWGGASAARAAAGKPSAYGFNQTSNYMDQQQRMSQYPSG